MKSFLCVPLIAAYLASGPAVAQEPTLRDLMDNCGGQRHFLQTFTPVWEVMDRQAQQLAAFTLSDRLKRYHERRINYRMRPEGEIIVEVPALANTIGVEDTIELLSVRGAVSFTPIIGRRDFDADTSDVARAFSGEGRDRNAPEGDGHIYILAEEDVSTNDDIWEVMAATEADDVVLTVLLKGGDARTDFNDWASENMGAPLAFVTDDVVVDVFVPQPFDWDRTFTLRLDVEEQRGRQIAALASEARIAGHVRHGLITPFFPPDTASDCPLKN